MKLENKEKRKCYICLLEEEISFHQTSFIPNIFSGDSSYFLPFYPIDVNNLLALVEIDPNLDSL